MKKVLFLLLYLSVLTGKAQNFEGVITWKFTTEITDPKVKAQMAEAQKKMNDPAMQAQMKEMEEKMNDPEFKKMMDSNPQLKAQMESAMKVMKGGDVNAMMPSGMVIKIKNQNALMFMDAGMIKVETLHLKDKNMTYKLDREAKTYSIIPPHKDDPNNKVDIKVTKTSETAKVLDYTCVKYIVDVAANDHTSQYFVWATTAIKDFDFKSLADYKMGNQQIFSEKLEGVPLKTEIQSPQGKMTMEVTEIKKQSLPSSDFTIPAGFREVQ